MESFNVLDVLLSQPDEGFAQIPYLGHNGLVVEEFQHLTAHVNAEGIQKTPLFILFKIVKYFVAEYDFVRKVYSFSFILK